MGVVYEAHDAKLDRRIALKCARFAHREQLPREVRNASEVSHPNVCKIFEIHTVVTSGGEIDFITMEFLDGETLSARLKREPLPESEARNLARQVCAGLSEAHRNNVIHGDFKSNNIILTKGPGGAVRAVITDFGLAHQLQALPGTKFAGQAGGTRGYMAPELLNGEKASIASDIYALGVVLFELLKGHRPDQHPRGESSSTRPPDTTAAATETLASEGTPPRVHPKWDRTLARCLDPDPRRRFASVDEVLAALAPGHRLPLPKRLSNCPSRISRREPARKQWPTPSRARQQTGSRA